MERILTFVLALTMCLSLAACGVKEAPGSSNTNNQQSLQSETADAKNDKKDNSAHEISTETVPMYIVGTGLDGLECPLYFKDGQKDIPYISMEDGYDLVQLVYTLYDDTGYALTMDTEGKVVTFTRENGSRSEIDFGEGTVAWDDYNLFNSRSYQINSLDVLSTSGYNAAGEPELFYRDPASFYRKGETMGLRFADFSIELMYEDGMNYMPMQTFSDLYLTGQSINLGYNGEAVFVIRNNDLGDMRETYYSVEPKERSEELAFFTYMETCLSLQFHYGLKELHDVPSFGTMFERVGIDEALKSPDPLIADKALCDVVSVYLDDMHSEFGGASPYAGDVEVKGDLTSFSKTRMNAHAEELLAEGRKFYPNGRPGYEEIGNTAYITFNQFTLTDDDYYRDPGAETLTGSSVGLIMYAHKQITRENSPIENVVLDMSLNTGGNVNAAIYTVGWMLGECDFHITDAMTEAQSSMKYKVDVNGDRIFDEKDSISHLNLYCLVSPVSFSCGNLVPCSLKASGNVTLIGRQTGGGACAVQPLITADGTLWQISSRMQFNTLFNGVFYNVDQGVAPDVVLSKDSSYYDRQGLTDMINEMK